jgi:sodium/potassium/calcium exchanger 6
MYNLASTADNYLSPSLEHMTVTFGLSDSLAGVTLLAFGNGAPDVFSAVAAAGGQDPSELSATKSVSVIMGGPSLGTFFITCIVISLATNASNINPDKNGPPIKMIKVTPRFYLRDISFFLITNLYLLYLMLVPGYINLTHALIFIAIYAIYVIIVVT